MSEKSVEPGGGLQPGNFNTLSGSLAVDIDRYTDAVAGAVRLPRSLLGYPKDPSPELIEVEERRAARLNTMIRRTFHQFKISLIEVWKEDKQQRAYACRRVNRKLKRMNFKSRIVGERDTKIDIMFILKELKEINTAGIDVNFSSMEESFRPTILGNFPEPEPILTGGQGVVTLTYAAVQNRCLQMLRDRNFMVDTVADFPELALIQVTGTHYDLRKLEPGDTIPFYSAFFNSATLDDFWGSHLVFTEESDPVTQEDIPLEKIHERINSRFQGYDPDNMPDILADLLKK